MTDKLLIANRGEIACRIIRSAAQMGLRTVAVYSSADDRALHTELADEACWIGPAPAAESYLDGTRIIEVARETGAWGIHPGYGFLAENADFARACEEAGLVFVGPPAAAIEAMGSKTVAKRTMADAGVPVIPGYHGDDQQPATLRAEARTLGFPLLIKAAAGGGGKGMRVVEEDADFDAALAAARRESASAFGDERMLLEKYLPTARHIEIQIFRDRHGGAVHLFERDCSMQRRHQKIIEEAPAPHFSATTRTAMAAAACRAAHAISYEGAGTVEFLLQGPEFYFMEMNTRLQVEHPVSECITGQDLVAWQLQVAAGQALPMTQEQLRIAGHAIEARIYAEDTRRHFLPTGGTLHHVEFPRQADGVRTDSGVRSGDSVGVHYDPLLAKIIASDKTREGARAKLRRALAETKLVGPEHNIAFLMRLVDHSAFAEGHYDTSFVEQHEAQLQPLPARASSEDVALICLYHLRTRERHAASLALASQDPYSPWHAVNGWRLNEDSHHRFEFDLAGEQVAVTARFRSGGLLVEHGDDILEISGELGSGHDLTAWINGRRIACQVVATSADHATLIHRGRQLDFREHDPLVATEQHLTDDRVVRSPMPGRITVLHVQPHSEVAQGDPLLSLEAMKMEHTVTAFADARVKRVWCEIGQQVDDGERLIELEQ